jgi:hypothetical protein
VNLAETAVVIASARRANRWQRRHPRGGSPPRAPSAFSSGGSLKALC